MQIDRIALALVALATPALAGKCDTCDDYFNDDLPAGLTAEPTAKEGTFFGKVVRAGMELARREKEKQQALGEPVTFTAQIQTTPPIAPRDGLAAPSAKLGDHEIREHMSFTYQKIIWTQVSNRQDAHVGQGTGGSAAGSSKPKEIVVVGSKLDVPDGVAAVSTAAPTKADGRHILTSIAHPARLPEGAGTWIHDVERPIIAGRVPQAVAVPASPAVPRTAGPTTLPAKVEFGAAAALRR